MITLDDDDRYRAPALDKGLDIIELLAETDDGLSQAEIAKALGRSPNEIYRMLERLVRRNYVRRTVEDRYEITLKLFEARARSTPDESPCKPGKTSPSPVRHGGRTGLSSRHS
ncbi:helix-turn-helix domain-containing protein [Devosia algicola]|uniref:helix-turn-helix domain-containing protein n=1 Tax=Devosia algicola TaxID=3026418 RepID=UPI002E1BA064